jgi:hypothetical protein
MKTVQITRDGDQSITEQLAGMHRWLEQQGIAATDLHALQIVRGRVTYSGTFEHALDADRFVSAFGDQDQRRGFV